MSNNKLIATLAAATIATTTIAAASLSVSNFSDYNPPSTLYITWGDYFASSNSSGGYSSDNAVTAWPRWSAEFPYRTLFFGGKYKSSGSYQQDYEARAYWVYSKQPASDVFTFEYIPDNRNNGTRTGYIRASFKKTLDYGMKDASNYYDINILEYVNAGGIYPGTQDMGRPTELSTYNPSLVGNSQGSDYYFEFDFYYECTDKHQSNTQLLNVSGLTSISVPYDYILYCDDHGTSGGSSGGTSGGGSSGNGSSGSVSSIPSPDKWPDTSLPSPWEPDSSSSYPWEDDKNTPDLGGGASGYPDVPTINEGTTGEDGGMWDPPQWNPPDLPFTSDDITIPPFPGLDLPSPEVPLPVFPDLPIPDDPVFPNLPIPDDPVFPNLPIPDDPVFPNLPIPDDPVFPNLPIPDDPVFPDYPFEAPVTVWPPPSPIF